MKQIAVAVIGALAGVVGTVAAIELKYMPGTWFSISGDPVKMQTETRVAVKPASTETHCLYRSERYKPGDLLSVADAGVKLVCTSGVDGGGQWLQVQQQSSRF
jgi:hypothetical protein